MRTFLRSKITLLFMSLGMLLAFAGVALAAELLVAEVDVGTPATPNGITVEQGGSMALPLSLTASGPIDCAITSTNPAQAKVYKTYSFTKNATTNAVQMSSTDLSDAVDFYAGASQGGNCVTTWDSTKNTVNATVSVAADVPIGTYKISLKDDSTATASGTTFPSDTYVADPGQNPGLNDGTATLITVNVVAPAVTAPGTPTLALATSSDSGDSTSDKKTNDDTPTFEGAAKAGSTVSVYDGSVAATNLLGTATANATTGAWSFTVPAAKALSEGTHTISATASNAGGTSTAATLSDVLIDKTAPAANCGSASASWSDSDATITCAPTDTGGSGLSTATATLTPTSFNLVTNVAAGTETNNASTNSRDIYDVAGNFATAGPINGNMVDKKAPSVPCGSADTLWHADDVSIGCTASDGGSGLADSGDASFNLSTNVTANTETSNASTDSRDVYDAVGNKATAGPISGNKVDKKGPAITLTTPASGATYTLGQSVNANYNCLDGGSGLLACLGTVLNGSAIDTSTIGGYSFSVNAEDNVANKSSASSSYSVAAAFNGFLQPIDGNMVNAGKVGRVYPVKWQLKDANNVLISDAAAQALIDQNVIKVQQRTMTCETGAPTDTLETEVAAGSTAVRYDAASDQFVYNYKAPATKGCYNLEVLKADGVNTKSIQFTFTK